MAKQEIEFEFTLEKLTLKVKGSHEVAQKVQAGLSRTLGNLADMQRLALPVAPAAPPNGQRPLPFESENGEVVYDQPVNGQPAVPAPEKVKRTRKANGVSLINLLRDLKGETFFTEARTADAIRDKLKTKGHTFSPSSIAARLQDLTKNDELFRQPSEQGYVYKDTKFDEGPRTQDAPVEPTE
jgi:hypothetical protein